MNYYELYREWLGQLKKAQAAEEADMVAEIITDSLLESAGYQSDTLVNGEAMPLIVTRDGTNKCNVTVPTGSDLNIGDLVYVYDEYWLCMEAYTDEYSVRYAVIWICNHLLRFQKHSLDIVETPMILDDGSYSSASEKSIVVADSKYDCYVSLTDDTRELFIDKRFALDIILDSNGEDSLLVDKITFLDAKTKNLGKGSHLLAFNIESDLYNPTTDSIKQRICDYTEPSEEDDDDAGDATSGGLITISGRDTLRIGTTRTYTATVTDESGETVEDVELSWSIDGDTTGITLTYDGSEATITVDADDELVGNSFTIICEDVDGTYTSGSKTVEVITNG